MYMYNSMSKYRTCKPIGHCWSFLGEMLPSLRLSYGNVDRKLSKAYFNRGGGILKFWQVIDTNCNIQNRSGKKSQLSRNLLLAQSPKIVASAYWGLQLWQKLASLGKAPGFSNASTSKTCWCFTKKPTKKVLCCKEKSGEPYYLRDFKWGYNSKCYSFSLWFVQLPIYSITTWPWRQLPVTRE